MIFRSVARRELQFFFGLALVICAPLNMSAEFPRSSPEAQGVSSAAILAFVESADRDIDAMHSFMLVRHGHVVAEGWWAPFDAKTPHVLYSLSKSFTSSAVGLAIAEGKLNVDDEVLKFFPEDAPAQPSANLKAMRVRDLLRMNTGQETEPARPLDKSWKKEFLQHPVRFKPGTHFLYNSSGTYMLAAIVEKTTGTPLEEYLRPRLFEPLGIEHTAWLKSPEGIATGGYGLSLCTEDIARFGQLYLQKGKWQGRQILPEAWVEAATSFQTSNGSNPKSDWDQGYGYQFWRSRHNSFRGDGAFGQYCMVLPEADAVVAITSGVKDMQRVMNYVFEKLLPAMNEKSLPEDSEARRALEAKLAGLAVRLPSGKPTVPLAAQVSGKWFEFPENDRGIQSLALDFKSQPPTLAMRAAGGETRTSVGIGSWTKNAGGFANGLDKFLGVPAQPSIAASGAWTADDVFTIKLLLYQTPYYSTLSFKFDGELLVFDAEHNVAFGTTKLPRLTSKPVPAPK